MRLSPDTWEPHNNTGIALTELGRYDEALIQFEEALRIRPSADSHYRLAVLYTKMNRFADAERHYLMSVHYNALMPEPYFELGVLYEKLRRRTAAVQAYREAVRLEPNYAFAHNNLANLLAEDGRLDEAIQHYKQALATDPALQDARQNLAAVQRLKATSTR
jgi:tetratricopeptide (TPR) repeat protein